MSSAVNSTHTVWPPAASVSGLSVLCETGLGFVCGEFCGLAQRCSASHKVAGAGCSRSSQPHVQPILQDRTGEKLPQRRGDAEFKFKAPSIVLPRSQPACCPGTDGAFRNDCVGATLRRDEHPSRNLTKCDVARPDPVEMERSHSTSEPSLIRVSEFDPDLDGAVSSKSVDLIDRRAKHAASPEKLPDAPVVPAWYVANHDILVHDRNSMWIKGIACKRHQTKRNAGNQEVLDPWAVIVLEASNRIDPVNLTPLVLAVDSSFRRNARNRYWSGQRPWP